MIRPGKLSSVNIERRERVKAMANADPFSNLPEYGELNSFRRWLLFYRLHRAHDQFMIRKWRQAIPTDRAAQSELDGIAHSVKRIADFWASREIPQISKAVQMLVAAGEYKAAKDRDKAAELKEPPETALDRIGAAGLLKRFFETAAEVADVMRLTRDDSLRRGGTHKTESPPAEWFYGKRLPEIYCRAFRREFKTTNWETLSANSSGVLFVCRAGVALGEDEISIGTAISHRKAAQRKHGSILIG